MARQRQTTTDRLRLVVEATDSDAEYLPEPLSGNETVLLVLKR